MVSEPGPRLASIWAPNTPRPWPTLRPRPGIRGLLVASGGQIYEAVPGEALRVRGPAPAEGELIGEDAAGVLWAADDGRSGEPPVYWRGGAEGWRAVPEEEVTDEARALGVSAVPLDDRWDRIVARADAAPSAVGDLSHLGLVAGGTLWAWSLYGLFYEDEDRVFRVRSGRPPVEVHGWGETDLVVLKSGEVLARSPWGNLLRGDARSVEHAGPAPEGGLPEGLAQKVVKLPNPSLSPGAWPRYRVELAEPPEGEKGVAVWWCGAAIHVLRGGAEDEAPCAYFRGDAEFAGASPASFIQELAVGARWSVWYTSEYGLHHLDTWTCRTRWTPWPELDLEPG